MYRYGGAAGNESNTGPELRGRNLGEYRDRDNTMSMAFPILRTFHHPFIFFS